MFVVRVIRLPQQPQMSNPENIYTESFSGAARVSSRASCCTSSKSCLLMIGWWVFSTLAQSFTGFCTVFLSL